MSVSKRLRYEILRRDNHACRYCGAKAPDVVLHIDHVIPEALGGTDEPTNLVTACADCNSGKSATPPDAPLVADVDARATAWAAQMKAAAEIMSQDSAKRDRWRQLFDEMWRAWDDDGRLVERPDDWRDSLELLRLAGLPARELAEAVNSAMTNRRIPAAAIFRYTMGICWTRVRKQQQIAMTLAAREDDSQESP